MKNPDFKQLFEAVKTIAIIGLSNKPERPSYLVAEYLKKKGFRIIPVNPVIKESLGEKSYPSLKEIQEPVDAVDVFRKSEYVAEIMAQAINIGAKVVWLQEGVINDQAAQKGRSAGLTVVMDRCMMKEHKKLFKRGETDEV